MDCSGGPSTEYVSAGGSDDHAEQAGRALTCPNETR